MLIATSSFLRARIVAARRLAVRGPGVGFSIDRLTVGEGRKYTTTVVIRAAQRAGRAPDELVVSNGEAHTGVAHMWKELDDAPARAVSLPARWHVVALRGCARTRSRADTCRTDV